MSTLNFTETLITVDNAVDCTNGVQAVLRLAATTTGEKTVRLTRENVSGYHSFGAVTLGDSEGISVQNLSSGGDLERIKEFTFNVQSVSGAGYVDFNILVFVKESRYNIIKAEIVNENVLDFVTIDCLTETPIITPTSSETPTPTLTEGFNNVWRKIPIFDIDKVLEIGDIIYSSDLTDKYSLTEIQQLNTQYFNDYNIFYVRQIQENVVYKVRPDSDNLDIMRVVDFELCPTQTVTPSFTPTNTRTPSYTPSSTATPTNSATYTPTVTRSNTPTQTITRSVTPTSTLTNTPTLTSSQTSPATGFNYYYIASNIQGLCYGVQTLIPTILVYGNDLANLLPKIQNAIEVSDWWGFEEIASRLPESGNFSRLYLRRTTDEDNNIIIVTKAAGTGQAFIIENTEEPVCITQTPTSTPTTTPTSTPPSTITPTQTNTPSITPSSVLNKNIFVALNRPSEYTEVINNRARYVHIFNSGDSFSVAGTLVLNQPIYAETNLEYNDVDLTSQYTLQSFRSILDSEDNQIIYVYSLDSQKFYELKNVQNILVVTAELPTPTATPTPSPTSTTQPTPTPSQTPTTTPPLTPLPTRTANPTGTPTNSVTPTISPTNSVTPTNTSTPHGTPTPTPTNTNTPTSSKTPTPPPTGTPTGTVTPVMLSKVIQISLNRLEIGRNYVVEIADIMNSDSEVRVVPTTQNIIASNHVQNIAVRLDFSGSVAIINLNIKVTDTVNGSVDYNTILVYTNNFQECY